MDAGRDARERVEQECETHRFGWVYSELCTLECRGTVEIRGSGIFISVEEVIQFGK